ncbi:unnamed protein product [Clavelina lepadiformis]|uniref:carnosine N-methyltransferase n=1 Tax=Clavelina lepadiformis TaxID=159417 RepID=A0ABP0EYQ8_CLALP
MFCTVQYSKMIKAYYLEKCVVISLVLWKYFIIYHCYAGLNFSSMIFKVSRVNMSNVSCSENDTKEEEKEEILHYMKVINAFKAYRVTALRALDECERNYHALPPTHKKMIPGNIKAIEESKVCIDCNALVIKEITKFCNEMFINKSYKELAEHVPFTSSDSDKVKSTLKQIVRDWSIDGEEERRLCYMPIIDEITQRLPVSGNKEIHVLVPGCGLGRLPWELAKLGYFAQGNEFSFFMLFTSNFILNKTPGESEADYHQFTLYPWVGKRCNNISWKDALRAVKFPDVFPGSLPFSNRLSMAAGDFMEIYDAEAYWDCVACCFFIDTAPNIISYLEKIYSILKPGGLFVNFGPLLYHFFGMSNERSIELSYQEMVDVIQQVGFVIIKQDWSKGLYTNVPRSMLNYEYNCALLVARKPDPREGYGNSK